MPSETENCSKHQTPVSLTKEQKSKAKMYPEDDA